AKRAAQHEGGSPRGSTLHHVVPPVKKIGRVAGIKREWPKTGERAKECRGPSPAVTKQIGNPEAARARGMGANGRRLPAYKIKIAVPRLRRLVAPGVPPLAAGARAVCRPVPLCFGGQRLAGPARISGGFRVADVNR